MRQAECTAPRYLGITSTLFLSKGILGDPEGERVEIDLRTLELNIYTKERNSIYEIDLETCTNNAEVMDWIFQVESKAWINSHLMGLVIAALNIALRPQQNLCSCGMDKTVEADAIRHIVTGNLQRHVGYARAGWYHYKDYQFSWEGGNYE